MEREISKLKANPQNPRGAVERNAAFFELVASIKSQGVLQSVLITPNDLIVAGHRRVEAAEESGLVKVPVIVKEMGSKIEQLQAMLAENLLRQDLNVLQEGAAYELLIGYGLTVTQIAKAIGVSSQRVSDCVAIQTLAEDVQRQFAWGVIPVSCAGPLVPLSPLDQAIWADKAIAQKWNGAALRNAIKGPTSRARSNGAKSSANPAPGLRGIVGQLENMDELLETYGGFRATQTLLRQAATQLIEALQTRKRAARLAQRNATASAQQVKAQPVR